MFAAFETLPGELKKAAEGKVAVHDASRNSAGQLRKGYKEVTDVRETGGMCRAAPLKAAKISRGESSQYRSKSALNGGGRSSVSARDTMRIFICRRELWLDSAHCTAPASHSIVAGSRILVWSKLAISTPQDPQTSLTLVR
jgi:hypothetical protein